LCTLSQRRSFLLTSLSEFGLVNVVVKPNLHELQRRDGTANVIAKSLLPLRAADVALAAHIFA